MIKNLDDILTFVVLLFLTLYSIRLYIYAYMKSRKFGHDIDQNLSKWQMFKDYNENTEE